MATARRMGHQNTDVEYAKAPAGTPVAQAAAEAPGRKPRAGTLAGLSAGNRDYAMLAGFALFQTWVTLCFFTPQLFPASMGSNRVYEISLVVSAVVLALGAVKHRQLAPALRSQKVRWALALCGAVGTALVPFCFGTGRAVDIALTAVASVLTGLATGLFNVAWCQAFVHRGNAIDFTVSVVASSIVIYILTNLAYSPAISPYVMLACSVAMPLVCAWLLCMGRDDNPELEQRMVVPIDTRPRKRFLVQLCVGVFVVSLTDEFMRNYYLEGTDLSFYSSQINLAILVFKVAISAMAVTAIHRMRYEDFSFLYRASFLLALVAALMLPFAEATGTLGYALTNCGAFLFKLTVLLVTLEFCAQGAPATLTFCVVRAVWSFDLLLGTGLYTLNAALPAPGMDPGMLTVVFVLAVAVAYLFVFSPDREGAFGGFGGAGKPERSPQDTAGPGTPLADGEGPGGQETPTTGASTMAWGAEAGEESAPDFEEMCAQLAASGGLSPREADVLRLLARGRTTARIQAELHISANTVNTHVKHVFQKLEVHSRQELLDLVEQRATHENR